MHFENVNLGSSCLLLIAYHIDRLMLLCFYLKLSAFKEVTERQILAKVTGHQFLAVTQERVLCLFDQIWFEDSSYLFMGWGCRGRVVLSVARTRSYPYELCSELSVRSQLSKGTRNLRVWWFTTRYSGLTVLGVGDGACCYGAVSTQA